MRKKVLAQKNAELTVRLHDSQYENSFLKNEIKKLRENCRQLEKQLEDLKAQKVQIAEEVSVPTEITAPASEPIFDVAAPQENLDTKLPFSMEYGSNVIGELVITAAKYADELSVYGEKYRELINLILGRTEVEKANILEIVTSDASNDDKKRMIDSCKVTCEEYFDSVMAQRCDN